MEVQITNNPGIRGLFKNYSYQVSVSSVIDGSLEGKIFVDNIDDPRNGLMWNPEGVFVAGNSQNKEFNKWLSSVFEEIIESGVHPVETDSDDLMFYIDNHQWIDKFPVISKSRAPFKVGRHHYTLDLQGYQASTQPPDGYSIQRVDKSLDIDSLVFPKDVWEWVGHSLDVFMERGFGAVLTHEPNVISWCLADCYSGDLCELGIITTENERKKGFGSLTVKAALGFCKEAGFNEVGWHCEAHNFGSIGTALKLGFSKKTDYYAWFCKFDKETHERESEIVKKYYP